ncbi:O-methyltransferase [Tenuifilum sp.]|uniref:O-methyltransferase n=1 Tax=Tenuifilum sp. TaxID=2760880 RepID=UPI00403E69CC
MRKGALGILMNYLHFRKKCLPKGGYGIHSPFVFDLYTTTIENDSRESVFESIEVYRKELLGCDIGIIRKSIAESLNGGFRGELVKLSRIARTASVPPHLGRLLYRIVNRFKPNVMLELGTSVGISSMYIAKANPQGVLYTIEGDEAVFGIAQKRFDTMNITNIKPICGIFETELPGIAREVPGFDFVFIDGDHNGTKLLQYFNVILPKLNENSVVVVDDIRWSNDMEDAWRELKANRQVSVSIDLFRCGVLFFRKGIAKQNFMLRYGPF